MRKRLRESKCSKSNSRRRPGTLARLTLLFIPALVLGLGLRITQVEFSRKVSAASAFAPQGITYVVNGTGDGDQSPNPRAGCSDLLTGKCTLRAAIQLANANAGADDITFDIPTTDPGFSNGTWTINLTRALDDISDSLNITGPGADKLIAQRAQGAPNFRIFTLTGSGTTNLSGLTITRGSANGGGILNSGMTVNVLSCVVKDNAGGGINNSGHMTIDNTVVSGNTAGLGGGIANHGSLDITNSTIAFNGGGGIWNGFILSIQNSTIEGNTLEGGIYNIGLATIANTTVVSNSAIGNAGGIFNNSTISLTNSTITKNHAVLDAGGVKYFSNTWIP